MNNKPLKRFGQNYLVDKNVIRKIVDNFDPQKGEKILEIGPGRGSLTELLIAKSDDVTAIEIDNRVIENLAEKYVSLNLVNDDFLKIDLKNIINSSEKIRVIGNIPYNITSSIIFKLLEHRAQISDAMLMVQFEVAKRITAGPGTKDYGILSVILNAFAEIELCFKISPNVFFPKPNVFSAIIHLRFNKIIPEDVNPGVFISIVKASFGNRRKTLKNSLKNSIFASCDLSSINEYLTKRAEQLTISDYFILTRRLEGCLDDR